MDNNAFSGSDGTVMTIRLNTDESIGNGSYQVKVTNTELTSVDDYGIFTIDSKDTSSTLTIQDPLPGDVNGDMKISVTDVSSIIGYILNDAPAIFLEKAADVNGDKKISVTDAVLVIDMILNEGKRTEAKLLDDAGKEPQ